MTAKSTNKSTERKAVFAGSFNPFTVGHASIVERALQIFDSIVIAVGINAEKPSPDAEKVAEAIRKLYNKENRVSVIIWSGLTADLALREGACCLVRGVRNNADYEYERNMAEINRSLTGVDTILFPALAGQEAVSSSIVRELLKYGADVSPFLPK